MKIGHLLLTGIIAHVSVLTAQPTSSYWIAVTNQATHQIECYDSVNYDNWNTAGAMKWSFAPATTKGYSSAELAGWGLPSDVKLRSCSAFPGASPNVIVTSDSLGLATIASYPAGERRWARVVGANPHAVELLPDGNIAIAASTGNWVRVYASSQGGDSGTYAQYDLEDAHGVLWDPALRRLWALGHHRLVALILDGSVAQPTLCEDKSRHIALPEQEGHDLSACSNDTDVLWVTTGSRVYKFHKSTNQFEPAPGAADRDSVKGCSSQPDGQIVQTKPKSGGCYSWSTDTVDFFDPAKGFVTKARHVNGACFYKARVFTAVYQ